jgi:hypothetical protein
MSGVLESFKVSVNEAQSAVKILDGAGGVPVSVLTPDFQVRPSPFKVGADGVRGQNFPQWRWYALIEENFHGLACGRLRHGQTLLRVFQDGLDLFARHALKPFEKIIHRCAAFKILESVVIGVTSDPNACPGKTGTRSGESHTADKKSVKALAIQAV